MNYPRKFIIGPHHGVKDFKLPYGTIEHLDATEMTWDELKEKAKGCLHTETNDIFMHYDESEPWGLYTIIEFPDEFLGQKPLLPYQWEFHLTKNLGTLKALAIEAYLTASGDDDTFDYTPSFIDSIMELLAIIDRETGSNHETHLKLLLKIADPDYPEYLDDFDTIETLTMEADSIASDIENGHYDHDKEKMEWAKNRIITLRKQLIHLEK